MNGYVLTNVFTTLSAPIENGSVLTVDFTVMAQGGYEGYVARNILVTNNPAAPEGGGNPIPMMSGTGVTLMVLLLMAGGVFLIRRLH